MINRSLKRFKTSDKPEPKVKSKMVKSDFGLGLSYITLGHNDAPAMTWTMTESAMPVVGPHVYFPPCSSLTFDILQGITGIKT